MSVYVVAQLTFSDRAAYARYQSRFMDVMRRFRGKVLAADEHPDVGQHREHARGDFLPDIAALAEIDAVETLGGISMPSSDWPPSDRLRCCPSST